MKLFGALEIWPTTKTGTDVALVEKVAPQNLSPVFTLSTVFRSVWESFAGAWQQNIVVDRTTVMSYFAVYACISLIAQDISKMRPKLMQQDSDDIWNEITSPGFTPVLRKPNHYQTRIKFLENWVTSKLTNGNAYILKEFDHRGGTNQGVVRAMYVLDPNRVTPLISDSGDVYYQLKTDYLAGLNVGDVTVPASEIIHDTAITLFHPLCGVSPLYACGLAATQGIKIQTNATKLFANMSRPSGMLVSPSPISDTTAAQLKTQWEANYGGENMGKTAVLGDGLKYEPLTITPQDAQLIEQLKMTAEVVCSVFHVPPYMVGIGAMPAYNNIEALNQQYYSQALQHPIEQIELLLDEGLALPPLRYGVELEIDNLLRMDTATRYKSHSDAVGGGWLAPNEARKKENYRPKPGGDTPYMQQQNYSLAALSKRDASDDPFKTATPARRASDQAPTEPTPPAPQKDMDADLEDVRMFADLITRGLDSVAA